MEYYLTKVHGGSWMSQFDSFPGNTGHSFCGCIAMWHVQDPIPLLVTVTVTDNFQPRGQTDHFLGFSRSKVEAGRLKFHAFS